MKPVQKEKILGSLQFYFPVISSVLLIISKFFLSNQLTIIKLLIIFALPCCHYIVLNKLFIEDLFFKGFLQTKIIQPKNYLLIFLTSLTPLIFVGFLTFIIQPFSMVGLLMIFGAVVYCSYLFSEYFILFTSVMASVVDRDGIKKYLSNYQHRNKIIVIGFWIYGNIAYVLLR